MTDSFQGIAQELYLEPRHTAVLVIDMLNDFLEEGGAMVLPEGRKLYPPIQKLVDAAHEVNMPVFWLNEELHPNDKLIQKRGVKCMAGTWGAQIVSALRVGPDDIRVPKRRYSGFFQTDLDLYLREYKIEHVIVTGLVTNICVRSTVHDAFFLGYNVIVPQDCVAATSLREQESSLHDIETHFGKVANLDDVLALFDAAPGDNQHAAKR